MADLGESVASFFDPKGKSGLTYDELKRRRQIATALASQRQKFPKTFGEGLTYFGEAMGERLLNDRLAAAEEEAAARSRGLSKDLEEQPETTTPPAVTPPASTSSTTPAPATATSSTASITPPPGTPVVAQDDESDTSITPQPQPTSMTAATSPDTSITNSPTTPPRVSRQELAMALASNPSLRGAAGGPAEAVQAAAGQGPQLASLDPRSAVAASVLAQNPYASAISAAATKPASEGGPTAAAVQQPVRMAQAAPSGPGQISSQTQRPQVQPVPPQPPAPARKQYETPEDLLRPTPEPSQTETARAKKALGAYNNPYLSDTDRALALKVYNDEMAKVNQAHTEWVAREKERQARVAAFPKQQEDLLQAQRQSDIDTRFGGNIPYQQFVTDMSKSRDATQLLANGMPSIKIAKKALADAYTGTGAEAKLDAGKVLRGMGVPGNYAPEVATEMLSARLKALAGSMIKSVVGSQNISDADRNFVEQAYAGTIAMEPENVKRMLRIAEETSIKSINQHNDRLYTVANDPIKDRALRNNYRVQMQYGDEATNYLKAHPETADKFDKMYGPGHAKAVLGGTFYGE